MKGGSERYYFTLADLLRSRGHQVVFFAMQDEKNIPCAQEKYFVSNASIGGGLRSKLNMVLHIAYSGNFKHSQTFHCFADSYFCQNFNGYFKNEKSAVNLRKR